MPCRIPGIDDEMLIWRALEQHLVKQGCRAATYAAPRASKTGCGSSGLRAAYDAPYSSHLVMSLLFPR